LLTIRQNPTTASRTPVLTVTRIQLPALGSSPSLALPPTLAPELVSAAFASTNLDSDRVPQLRILVVDDDAPIRNACSEIATNLGYSTQVAESVAAARLILAHSSVDILLLDLKLPGGGSLSLLESIRAQHPQTIVVVMTAYATVDSAVESMRVGAGDYLTKPFTLDELNATLSRAARRRTFDVEASLLRDHLPAGPDTDVLVGNSPAMEKLRRILSRIGAASHPVLILGESGTGKRLFAHSIHDSGPNADRPFITIDCGSLNPATADSELFGQVKGAFAGSGAAKTGLLTAADSGTIFFDGISELPIALQGRLLRAMQDREVGPIGSSRTIPFTARVLASTTRDLSAMVETGRFRKDLFFRLNVVNLRIPALRERTADIPLLAAHILNRMGKQNSVVYTFADDALRLLMDYDWPGNVRELEHAIERASAFSSGPVLHLADFPTQMQDYEFHSQQSLQHYGNHSRPAGEDPELLTSAEPLTVQSIADLEKRAILSTITQLKGDKVLAAHLLGIGKTTLYRKLKEYGLSH
jgi:DNA-binding NtrC family response regulator